MRLRGRGRDGDWGPAVVATTAATLPLVVLGSLALAEVFVMDETVFVRAARAAGGTGRPLYYKSEQVATEWGLWHPPTYVYFLGAWFAAAGTSEVVARGATFLATLLTVPAVYGLTRTVVAAVPERTSGWTEPRWALPALAVFLYATAPLVVQNGTLVDIDGSLLALVIAWFFWWFLATYGGTNRRRPSRFLGLAGWFAAIAWVKFGALPALLLTVLGYLLVTRGWRETSLAGVSIAAGLVGFVASWWGVAAVLGLRFPDPFVHNFGMVLAGGGSQSVPVVKRLLLSGWTGYTEVLWISPFLLALALLTLVPTRGRTDLRTTVRDPVLPLLAFSLLTVAQYAVLAKLPYGFPKYMGPAMPLLAVSAAVAVGRALPRPTLEAPGWRLAAGLAVLAGFVTVVLPDPFLVEFNGGAGPPLRRAVATVALLGVGAGVAYVTLPAVPAGREGGLDRRGAVTLALVTLLVGTNLGLAAGQATADYSTRYFYGQRGMDEAVEQVRERYRALPTEERAAVVVPPDVGYYLDGRYHDSQEFEAEDLGTTGPPLVVQRTRTYYAVDTPLLEALNESDRYRAEPVGSFVVFERENRTR